MATSPIAAAPTQPGRRIGVRRLTVAGAITAVVVFVLCWAGTVVPFSSPTHTYIGLFTTAPNDSATALAEGALWSLLFGALTGGLFALIYNATAALDRR